MYDAIGIARVLLNVNILVPFSVASSTTSLMFSYLPIGIRYSSMKWQNETEREIECEVNAFARFHSIWDTDCTYVK